jgi:predicted GIY-YIG superfamily endonuclease
MSEHNFSTGLVYILKFEQPIGSQRHQAQFYIGYCEPGRLDQRLQEHAAGIGAAITRAICQRGIGFEMVASFPGDRTLERRLKRQKNTRRIVDRYRRGTLVL